MKFLNKYLLAFAFLFLLFGAKETFACSCVPTNPTSNEDFQKADAVFTGQVLDVKRKENSGMVEVKIAVQKYWKGNVSKQTKIMTAKDSAMCGFNFEVGKSYLVYANKSNGKLLTTNCTRTSLIGVRQS
jgi:hypothetical protein